MNNKLEPYNCGCGGQGEVQHFHSCTSDDVYFVRCNKCGAETFFKQTQDEAIKTWNKSMGIRCKDCVYWDKIENVFGDWGYCHAIKHRYSTKNWEIDILRKYQKDFFCADAELKEKDEDECL